MDGADQMNGDAAVVLVGASGNLQFSPAVLVVNKAEILRRFVVQRGASAEAGRVDVRSGERSGPPEKDATPSCAIPKTNQRTNFRLRGAGRFEPYIKVPQFVLPRSRARQMCAVATIWPVRLNVTLLPPRLSVIVPLAITVRVSFPFLSTVSVPVAVV